MHPICLNILYDTIICFCNQKLFSIRAGKGDDDDNGVNNNNNNDDNDDDDRDGI